MHAANLADGTAQQFMSKGNVNSQHNRKQEPARPEKMKVNEMMGFEWLSMSPGKLTFNHAGWIHLQLEAAMLPLVMPNSLRLRHA